MSISYRTYIGPYVECVAPLVDVTRTRRVCTNPQCASHARALPASEAFCSRCGSPVGNVPYTEREFAVLPYNVADAVDGRLYNPMGDAYYEWSRAQQRHLWLPNVAVPGLRDPHLERADFAVQPLDGLSVGREVDAFAAFFAPELKILAERYGAGNVFLRWGVIQDYA